MGNSNDKNVKLSPELQEKVMSVFRRIDVDGSKKIDKDETIKFWKSNFAKINTNELFKSVDVDNSGTIEEQEWLDFWISVKNSGHTEEEIEEELQNLMDGFAWVHFDKVDNKKASKKDKN